MSLFGQQQTVSLGASRLTTDTNTLFTRSATMQEQHPQVPASMMQMVNLISLFTN